MTVDDFGAGYPSMENIMIRKPDYIKIDGSLIQEVRSSEESLAILKSVLQMGRKIKAYTVAEHLHSRSVYETVKELGVDYMLGYSLAEPSAAVRLFRSCVAASGH